MRPAVTLSRIYSALREIYARFRHGSYAALACLAVLVVFLFGSMAGTGGEAQQDVSLPAPEGAPLRLLFVSLEYKAGTFSGNGVYAQSMVRSLARLGHEMFVVSAAPPADWGGGAHSWASQDVEAALWQVEVGVWGRLDWQCAWEAFGAGLPDAAVSAIVRFRPHWCLAVDWSALPVYEKLLASPLWGGAQAQPPPLAYLNYRVYSLSHYGSSAEAAREETQFYRRQEAHAVALASAVAALSTRDASFLCEPEELGQGKRKGVTGRALLPPLREDIRQLAIQAAPEWAEPPLGEEQECQGGGSSSPLTGLSPSALLASWASGRSFLACCVRLSPEKNAALFGALVEELAPFLLEQGVRPLLCMGAPEGITPYGARIRERVTAAMPSAHVVEGFSGPKEMARLYGQTLLNLHPCLYDAYGMTVVEASAFGAPSLLHQGRGGAVGAAELLDPAQGLSLPVDLGAALPELAQEVRAALLQRERLARVGTAAAQRSVAWNEACNARQLTSILQEGQRKLPHID
eukprot:TRINITY_DN35538_c0_g1_i1.p1 TRINITY_DN35538_c0_g1~~TRINITY_DN35538_c0_g1_i1.p1  ORF type:complete len:519 (-),score=109.41 TRINITY_DN35538_c0_g1_i1:467-2023(-)